MRNRWPGGNVTARVRFADLHAVTRSSDARRADFGDRNAGRNHRRTCADRACRSPAGEDHLALAISVSHLEKQVEIQLDLPLGLPDEHRRPGTKRGIARWTADKAVDKFANVSGGRRSGMGRRRWKFLVCFGRIPRTCRKGAVTEPADECGQTRTRMPITTASAS